MLSRLFLTQLNYKIGGGILNFDTLCNESILRLTKQILEDNQKLNRIKEDPKIILTELFNGKGYYNQLTDTIKTFGKEFTIHDFQKYIYSILIPFLKEELGEHCDFSFYENSYPSYLTISYGDYDLAALDIHYKSIRVRSPLYISSLEKELTHYNERLNDSKNLLRRFEKAGMNPFKICDNHIDFFYYIFHFKTYKAKIEYAVNQIKKDIDFYTKQINSTVTRLNKQLSVKDDIEACTQEIVDYFSNYGYEINR